MAQSEREIRKRMAAEYNEYLRSMGREQLARDRPSIEHAMYPVGGPKLLSDAERGCISPLGNLAQPTKGK